MGLLDNVVRALRGGRSFDLCLGDEGIRGAYRQLQAGEWNGVDEFLNSRPDGWLVADILTGDRSKISTSVLERWAQSTRSCWSLTMLGAAQTRDAWAIRGRAYASDVNQNAWQGFIDGLEQAESTLQLAARLHPASAEPWAAMLTTARGLQMGPRELHRRFDEAHKRFAFHPAACDAMLQGLCAKWSGSHEQMFGFARWVYDEAPASSPAQAVLPMAYIERDLANLNEGRHLYSTQTEAFDYVCQAADRYLAAVPKEVHPVHLGPLGAFVWLLWPVDGRSARLLKECVTRIADRPTTKPWIYYSDDIDAVYKKVSGQHLTLAARYETQLEL